MRSSFRVLLPALTLVLVAACGGSGSPNALATKAPGGQNAAASGGGGTALTVTLKEWTVTPDKTTLPAGKYTITVKNAGSSAHDLTVLKTDLAPDKIPQDGAKASEQGKVGATPAINPGSSADLTVDLAAGHYVFICNEPGHYSLGMHTEVTVQ